MEFLAPQKRRVLVGLWPQGCPGPGGEREGGKREWEVSGLGGVGSTSPADSLLVILALRSKCPLGLCFLCNIVDFDTRCQAVSV